MKKLLLYIILGLLGLYIGLKIVSPLLPDWLRIILNADPRYIDEAMKVAKETYDYDKRRY